MPLKERACSLPKSEGESLKDRRQWGDTILCVLDHSGWGKSRGRKINPDKDHRGGNICLGYRFVIESMVVLIYQLSGRREGGV